MSRLAATLFLATLVAMPVHAQVAPAERLYEALRLDDVLAVMRDEGLDYATQMEDEMFAGRGGEAWRAVAGSIYAADRMEERIAADFAGRLSDADLEPIIDFFTSELGREIVSLEIEARRAMQDESVEEMVVERAADMRAEDAPRIDLLDEFVEVNELVDANVAGALNANYAFFLGLADGGALDGAMSEDQMVADVWAQEPEIRADTFEWVNGYLNMAYQPLSDEELSDYTEFARSDAGQALNTAIFGAFDAMYVDISRALGQNAARFMTGEDI